MTWADGPPGRVQALRLAVGRGVLHGWTSVSVHPAMSGVREEAR